MIVTPNESFDFKQSNWELKMASPRRSLQTTPIWSVALIVNLESGMSVSADVTQSPRTPCTLILRDAAMNQRSEQQSKGAARQQYVKQTEIKASPEVVFRFHESPGALKHLIPPWENMKLVESAGSLQPGSRVVLRGRLGIIPIQWVAIHTEYDPPHLFADRQESGPFAYWYHRHRFLDDGQGGTLLRDEVEYAVPLGVIGQLLGGWLVRRKLEAMFVYRHEKTRSLIESGEWASALAASAR